jgi:hypothetical protein
LIRAESILAGRCLECRLIAMQDNPTRTSANPGGTAERKTP